MVDVRELLDSAEMNDVVRAIEALRRRYIHLWAARAKYVAEHIFARMDDLSIRRKTDRLLGEVSPVKFKPPKLDLVEVDCFDHTFRRFIRY